MQRVAAILTNAGTGAQVRMAGRSSFISIAPGAELLPGDVLHTGDISARLMGCRADRGILYSLPANVEVTIRSEIPAQATELSKPDPDCILPLDDRTSRDDIFEPRVSDLPGDWHDRLPRLSQEIAAQLKSVLDPVERTLAANPTDLPALVAKARYLDMAGLAADAIRQYLSIFKANSQAAWAARSASRLAGRILPQGDVAEPLPPDLSFVSSAAASAGPPPGGIVDPKGDVYALLVGISTYPPDVGVENLKYAEEDAKLFKQYLQSARGRRVQNIATIDSSNGTAANIRSSLENLVANHPHSSDNTLIIFIAAHGYYGCVDKSGEPARKGCAELEQEPFILTTDSSAESPLSTGVPMRLIQKLVTENAYRFGRVLLYIDVCHSGFVRWDRRAAPPPPDAIKDHLEPKLGAVGLMLASSENEKQKNLQYAYESDELKHGIFTYYVISDLAQDKPSAGGVILLKDLASHVAKQVEGVTGGKQLPSMDSSDKQTLAVVADVNADDFSVPTPETPQGKISFRSRSKGRDRWASPLPVPEPPVAGPPPGPTQFEEALRAGRLLPSDPKNAFAALQSLDRTLTLAERLRLRKRLRVALEDRGQQILLQYIQGDQVPQKKEAFQLGAELFQAALTLAPGAAFDASRMLFCQGRAAIFEKQYSNARGLLDQAIRLDPEGAWSYNALGISLLEQLADHPDYLSRAIAAFEDASRLEPTWAYPLHNLALAYGQQGDSRKAIATYKQAMEIAPAYSYLPYNLGLLYERNGDNEHAETYFELAAECAAKRGARLGIPAAEWTERAAPLTALGTLYLNEGRLGAAGKEFDAALTADAAYVPALHDKGILLERKGRPSDAILLWRRALSLDPGYTAARLSLAETLMRTQDFDHAALEYQEILASHPAFGAARRSLALALVSLGDLRGALDQFTALLRYNPNARDIGAEKSDLVRVIEGGRAATQAIRQAMAVRAWR